MSFKALIDIEDKKDIVVLSCSFSFHQSIDNTGKIVSKPSGGIIDLELESSDDTDLLSWMIGHNVTKNGVIRFLKRENEGALKKLAFTDGVCINYHEKFTDKGDSPMITSITISARVIEIGTAKFQNLWTNEDYNS